MFIPTIYKPLYGKNLKAALEASVAKISMKRSSEALQTSSLFSIP